jgi:hypothetical protein
MRESQENKKRVSEREPRGNTYTSSEWLNSLHNQLTFLLPRALQYLCLPACLQLLIVLCFKIKCTNMCVVCMQSLLARAVYSSRFCEIFSFFSRIIIFIIIVCNTVCCLLPSFNFFFSLALPRERQTTTMNAQELYHKIAIGNNPSFFLYLFFITQITLPHLFHTKNELKFIFCKFSRT